MIVPLAITIAAALLWIFALYRLYTSPFDDIGPALFAFVLAPAVSVTVTGVAWLVWGLSR